MEPDEWARLERDARQIGKILAATFEGVTGEPLALDNVVRRYPLATVGVAAGAGAILGMWFARRQTPALPAPPPPVQRVPLSPLEYLEQAIPAGLDRAVEALPEEAAGLADAFVHHVVEPRLREGLDSLASAASEGRLGHLFRDAFRRRPVIDHESSPEDSTGRDESPAS